MGRIAFENFGLASEKGDDFTVMASRYKMQKTSEKNIVSDVIKKLSLKSTDTVLDIGCNAGNILIPLSFVVQTITGLDHSKCIDRLRERFSAGDNIQYISGNFLDINLTVVQKFNKILIYSVLHYLEDQAEVYQFIDKSLALIADDGVVMLGDIPNISKEERFFNSTKGKLWLEDFNRQRKAYKKTQGAESIGEYLKEEEKDDKYIQFDDELIMEIMQYIRQKGYNSYVLPQTPALPFGNTREDIIISK